MLPQPATVVRDRVEKWFFAHFFSLLLLALSVAQAGVVWWVARAWMALGVPALALLSVATFAFNRWWIRRRPSWQRAPVDRLPRLYNAAVFTCLFCGLWLLANHAGWTVARYAHQALASEARGAGGSGHSAPWWPAGPRTTGWMGLFMVVGLFGWGYTFGQRALTVRRLTVRIPRLPAALHGLRVVQLSDIHVGTNMTPQQLAHFVDRANALAPDLICITGDIADHAGSDLELYFPILARLRARLGVVAILGNHDHYAGAQRVSAALARHTLFHVLRDQVLELRVGAGRLWVLGLDDRGRDWARGLPAVPQLAAMVREIPSGDPKILLAHRPDVFPQAAELGIELVLSGHTHGGQLALPGLRGRPLSLARFITRYDRGLFREGGSTLYVNCGLGVTGQRIRLFTPREITVLELHGSDSAEAAHACA